MVPELKKAAIGRVTTLPGCGINAQAHGNGLVLGNHRPIEEHMLCRPEIEVRLFCCQRRLGGALAEHHFGTGYQGDLRVYGRLC